MISGFNGPFAINLWTQLPGTGMTINTSSTQIQFAGTTARSNRASYMEILMPDDYIITFDWTFTPTNSNERLFDPFGYYTNTTLVYLTNRTDSTTVTPSSGSVSLYLTKNTLFRYFKWISNVTNSTATVTNFKYQQVETLSFANNFTGDFVQGNWLINNTNAGTSVSINSTTITMNANTGFVGDGTISITPNVDRIITFDWTYSGIDLSTNDWFGLYLNTSPVWMAISGGNLTNTNPPGSPLSGSVGIYVPANTQLQFLKHANTLTTSQCTVTNFKFASLSSPTVPCFALSNIIKYQLPSDASIVYKNQRNSHWININDLYLTRDHVVKVNDKLLIAENASSNIVNEEDDVVDIKTSDGRFIVINNVEVATSK